MALAGVELYQAEHQHGDAAAHQGGYGAIEEGGEVVGHQVAGPDVVDKEDAERRSGGRQCWPAHA